MIGIDLAPLFFCPPGGVRTALENLIDGFLRLPHGEPVRWFAPRPLDLPDHLEDVVTPPEHTSSPRAWRRRLPSLLEREGVHILYSPWSAFCRTRIPVVPTVHELPFVRWGAIEGRLRTWRHRRWLARDVRGCAGIVVPSEATRSDLVAEFPEAAERVSVVPWGFDPAPWEEVAGEVPASAPAPYAVMLGAGASGGGARKKGLDVARAAFDRLKGRLDLVVVGEEEQGGSRSARPVVPSPPPWLPQDLPFRHAVVAAARLLVYPSRSEGFGFPPLEAMAAGVPVVASRAGSIPEVVGDAALLVPPGDADALAAAVERVVTDEALRADLILKGRVRCRAFPPEVCARRLTEVLARAREGA